MKFKTGVKRDGTITGMEVETLLDGGAYGSYGVASTFYTGALQTVTYHIPTYRFHGCRVFTNKPPCGPKRGHGTPQSRFGQEIQLDKIAEALSLDPAEMRLRTVEHPDTLTANYLRVGTIGLSECIRRVTKAADWSNRFRKLPVGRGLGLACSSYLSGAGLPIYYNDMPHSGVQLKLDRSGGVTAFCGATEIGQGSDDVLVGCVAEILGIDPIDIRPVTGDTDLTPVDLGSYSSRVTLMMGNAAIQAAERARDLLVQAVSEKLHVPGEASCSPAAAVDAESPHKPDRGVASPGGLPGEAKFGTIGTTVVRRRSPRHASRAASVRRRHIHAASIVEVEVDPSAAGSTFRASGSRTTSAVRSTPRSSWPGRSSVYMALNEADGRTDVPSSPATTLARAVHKFPSMLNYKSPTTLDMPEVITGRRESGSARTVRQRSRTGPLLPVMPAIANAVATRSASASAVPITPRRSSCARSESERARAPLRSRALSRIDWPEPFASRHGMAAMAPPVSRSQSEMESSGAAVRR
jgi:4-hydroxybenzoyl-CoA reductase subunit alpha